MTYLETSMGHYPWSRYREDRAQLASDVMRTRLKADHGREREAISDDSQTRSVPARLDKCENRLN